MFYPEVIYGRKVVLWVLGILAGAAALTALAVAIIPDNVHVPPGSARTSATDSPLTLWPWQRLQWSGLWLRRRSGAAWRRKTCVT